VAEVHVDRDDGVGPDETAVDARPVAVLVERGHELLRAELAGLLALVRADRDALAVAEPDEDGCLHGRRHALGGGRRRLGRTTGEIGAAPGLSGGSLSIVGRADAAADEDKFMGYSFWYYRR